MVRRYNTSLAIALFAFSSGVLLIGCNDSAEPMVGADEDEHGCKSSAGYSWCAKTDRCERPWELAKQKGFENTEEAFADYCSNEKENE